jgi:hypothetical protein
VKADKFIPETHYKQLEEWSKMRGLGMVPLDLLPKTGRIVSGVCAAFLYLTDSKVGFLENMISNPAVDRTVSSDALDSCVRAIEQDAKSAGVQLLWSSTCLPAVLERADRLGFVVQKRAFKLILKGL